MQYTHMAMGLTPASDEMHAVAVEWSPGKPRVRVSVFEHETGQLIVSSAEDMPSFKPASDAPDDDELLYVVKQAATGILPNGLSFRDRALSRVLLAVECEAIQWWGPCEVSREFRNRLEVSLEAIQ